MKKLFAILLFSVFCFTSKGQVVISQAYGGGGNGGSTYTNDFVELFNASASPVSLNGWSIQYNSATSNTTTWQMTLLPNVVLQPGQYFLVQEAQGAGGTTALPTPDVIGVIAMSGTAGKVALVNGVTAFAISCPTAGVIDFVGYGTTANCFEGAGPTPAPSNTVGVLRLANGCTDNNSNNTDFVTGAPTPRNTATTLNPCGGGSPSLSATALTAFGNICTNTTAGPNSFTITGSTLSTANVTVGALSGFTYATTAGGSYTTSLSLTQPGGAFSQQIFVKFSPVAVQSYSGNIPVGGGGATSINVAASGAGVNTIPSLTTGAASSITASSATLAGTISATGCTAVTAYGVEYSTTNGFANGSGTPVAASNLAAGIFSSNVGGLAASTIYYYHAFATNGGGTGYGTQQTFTTSAPIPALSATTLTAFGNVCTNTTAGPNSFTITGTNLTVANIAVGPLSGFTFSTTAGGSYTASLNLTQAGGAYSQQVFVNFNPIAVQSYSGNILISGGGAPVSVNVAASGAGVNTIPSLTTGAASAITTTSATLAGSITSTGCTAITAYGIEFSTTPGFANGTGTPVASSNLSGGNFSSDLIGLTPNTTYYYHAYATNTGGTGYGSEQFFTTQALTPTLSATGLTAFGSICTNTTAGPNSFTINGSALTNANVAVAALAGFTYSTTAGGTYTSTLTLTQGGGTFTQQVFVKFNPTAVQSYNGNIVISGGGAPASANVAASGAGINTTPSVTTGAASAITSISATTAGSIPANGCTTITAYGIEYSTTNGFPNGTGTAVASANLSGGNFTSALTGLTPTTTYYYHAYATNGGGTSYGAQQSFVTATPVISSSALAAFGNVCTNITAGPNSITLTGTNLTAANITIGPLAGFTFSTTAGGTYTASLNLTQPSGAYSQAIYVDFTPVAVQSYSGNIPVSGGGAVAISVAVTAAGINTAATVNTGAASAITQISATAAGSIPAIGCTAISAYGIDFSTTNGFPAGTGTRVASSNLAGGNFSSALTGLAPSTTYYYKAFATNAGGTSYGTQQSFVTAAPVLAASVLTGFTATCINTTAGPNSFVISSTALTTANINIGALNGYSFSTTAAGVYTSTLSLTQPGGPYTQTIYVKFTPVAVQSYTGNISITGGGAPATVLVFATGAGINTAASVTTGSATVLSANAATLNGAITANGCSTVTVYGIEYSGINGFVNGTGTKIPGANFNAGNFSASLSGLVQGSTYYYKAYAANSGGIAYGAQASFTTNAIPDGLIIYSNPLSKGGLVHFSLNGIKPGHYAARLFNSNGQLVFQKDMIIAVNFIDDQFILPAILGTGVYSFQIASPEYRKEKTIMIW